MQAVNAAGSGDYSDLLTTITSEDSKSRNINDVTIPTSLPIVFLLACMCSVFSVGHMDKSTIMHWCFFIRNLFSS